MHISNFDAVKDLLVERNIIEGFIYELTAEDGDKDDFCLLYGSQRSGSTFKLTTDLAELVLEAAKARNTVALAKLGVKVD